jgi:hypothetical protein
LFGFGSVSQPGFCSRIASSCERVAGASGRQIASKNPDTTLKKGQNICSISGELRSSSFQPSVFSVHTNVPGKPAINRNGHNGHNGSTCPGIIACS